MSSNKYQPHVLVLPEDDANSQLAIGFQLAPYVSTRKMSVLRPAGGWIRVLDCFEEDHISFMDRYPLRFMVLLIDFDQDQDRMTLVRQRIPARLSGRVFVVGAWTNPEELRSTLHLEYEDIGRSIAKDCHEDANTTLENALLKHNSSELSRLRESVMAFLFS